MSRSTFHGPGSGRPGRSGRSGRSGRPARWPLAARVTVVAGLLSGAMVGGTRAAQPPAEEEFFRMEELSPDVALSGRQFYIPTVFGPTGMNGWMHGETLVVREVETDSPADGIALPNDVITHVNGQPLGSAPLEALGEQVEVSERTGRMELRIRRSGQARVVTIPVRRLGSVGEDWPFDCAKSRAIHLDACEYLARHQNRDGLFDGKIWVGFALDGLTWLASDDPRYQEHARRLAYGYRKEFDPEAISTINWEWSYMGVFLAEYYLKTGDDTVLPLCQEIAQSLAQSQQPCGTWGHGSYPGLGYVQGGSLNNCGLVCWLALVLFREAGVDVDPTALDKATGFFSRFAHRGGVPYGDHRPEFGGGNGKNAIPGVVHRILGDRAASEYYARLVTGSYRGRTSGHTGGFMGFIWGNMQGARNPHREDYRRMLEHWRWLLDVSRRWDGGFLLPESVIGKIYRRYRWLTYTSPRARKAFEELAADPSAGIYRSLARRELATPDDATLWAYYCELLWKGTAADWRVDELAKATALRVADMPSGHWPKIAALNELHAAGVLTDRLESWTPLVAASTKGYPGERRPWRMLSVRRKETPPVGWTEVDFDDRAWEEGTGPLVGGRDEVGLKVQPNCVPCIRIAFETERTDHEALVVLIRLLRASRAVVYLNGEAILFSDALQGPRMRIDALTTIPLRAGAMRRLRRGRNVLSMRVSSGQGADVGLYASEGGRTLAFVPRPRDWAPGPEIASPDLSRRTRRRPALETVLPPCTTGLAIDPPGGCNDSLGDMRERLIPARDAKEPIAMPLAERARYLGHLDSRIRRLAAFSLMSEGSAAMPFIREALRSDDIRVVRAGCDAIAGSFGMNGLGKGNFRKEMTPDIAGAAVPDLLPLLRHEDLYIRERALLALSNCGKAAARHLDQVSAAADDEDWWVRSAAAQVLHYVREPETAEQIATTIRNYLAEESTFGRNRLRSAVAEMAKRGHGAEEAVAALLEEAEGESGFHAAMALGALADVGPAARAALPLFERKLFEARKKAEAAADPAAARRLMRDVRKWEGVIRKTTGAPPGRDR